MPQTPLVTVVIEGYNEQADLGELEGSLEGLKAQTFPAKEMEIIGVGSPQQVEIWQQHYGAANWCQKLEFLAVDKGNYYQYKNVGLQRAQGQYIFLLDSDTVPFPRWIEYGLRHLERGVQVVAGASVFCSQVPPEGLSGLFKLAASCVTWSFILGRRLENGHWEPASLLANNCGLRREALEFFRFPEQYGRRAGSTVLGLELSSRARWILEPKMCVRHSYSFNWWLRTLHFRFGHEIYILRRSEPNYPHRWVRKLGVLEPVLSFGWRVPLDIPRAWRYLEALEIPLRMKIPAYAMALTASVLARGAEAAGMYATMLAPRKMEEFALSH